MCVICALIKYKTEYCKLKVFTQDQSEYDKKLQDYISTSGLL
jgi:hypothetical protein